MKSARLIVKREAEFSGMARRRRVLVDGTEAARIRNGEEITIDVAAGRHFVKIVGGSSESDDLEVEIGPGVESRVGFCGAGNGFQKLLFGPYWPRPNILLSQDGAST